MCSYFIRFFTFSHSFTRQAASCYNIFTTIHGYILPHFNPKPRHKPPIYFSLFIFLSHAKIAKNKQKRPWEAITTRRRGSHLLLHASCGFSNRRRTGEAMIPTIPTTLALATRVPVMEIETLEHGGPVMKIGTLEAELMVSSLAIMISLNTEIDGAANDEAH